MKKERVGLVDADIVAYNSSASCEIKVDWENDGEVQQYTQGTDLMFNKIDDIMNNYISNLKLDKLRVYLSSPSDECFRKDYLPTYKQNRKATLKPKLLDLARAYLFKEYGAIIESRLEADDLLGIDATTPNPKEQKIIISIDKDMKTIPVWQNNPDKGTKRILKQTELDAFRYHMEQTVLGDTTDGYAGCYGSGKVAWEALLNTADQEAALWANNYQYKCILWKHVVAEFVRKGFTEEDALVQARCAHILWAEDYDFETKEVTPWEPPR